MKTEQKCLQEQIAEFCDGKYNNPSFETQCEAGWYDWFCSEKALANKTKVLYNKVIKIMYSKKINPKTQYVFFKNNCPMSGSLYDDFRICDMTTGNVIYTVVPKSGHKSDNGKGEIWGKENNFEKALFIGKWKEIVKWFYTE